LSGWNGFFDTLSKPKEKKNLLITSINYLGYVFSQINMTLIPWRDVKSSEVIPPPRNSRGK
jgi:hypothetical protein